MICFRLLLAEISSYLHRILNKGSSLPTFSSPSGGDQFISLDTHGRHGYMFQGFRLLLAEISSYRRWSRNGLCEETFVFVSFWRRSVHISEVSSTSKEELSFSSPSGGDQFISNQAENQGAHLAYSFRLLLAEISSYPY